MSINRREMLAGSTAALGLPFLGTEALASDDPHAEAPKDAVILTAAVVAKEGKEDQVKEILASIVEPTRKEKGCVHYLLHQAADDKKKFMFYEVWASRDALKQHGQTPHLKSLGPRLSGLTGKGGGVTFYQLVK